MNKIENLNNLNEDSKSGDEPLEANPVINEMDQQLKEMAEDIERNNNENKYEKETGQNRLEYVRNLRRQIMGMDFQELGVFKERYLPSLSKEMVNAMELAAVNDAISERS